MTPTLGNVRLAELIAIQAQSSNFYPADPMAAPEHGVDDGSIPNDLAARGRYVYYYDRYYFKAFESLHVLNILQYERELCNLSAKLARRAVRKSEAGNTDAASPPGTQEANAESEIEKLRRLLRGHGKYQTYKSQYYC